VEILTSQQMRRIDRRATGRFGVPEIVLMENAGLRVLEVLRRLEGDLRTRRLLLLCGLDVGCVAGRRVGPLLTAGKEPFRSRAIFSSRSPAFHQDKIFASRKNECIFLIVVTGNSVRCFSGYTRDGKIPAEAEQSIPVTCAVT